METNKSKPGLDGIIIIVVVLAAAVIFFFWFSQNTREYEQYLEEQATSSANSPSMVTAAPSKQYSIEKQFSPWDGSHRNLEKYIKENMHDEDSYEHVDTYFYEQSDHLRVTTVFKGKNTLGGTVKQSITANVSLDGEILEIIE